MKFNTSKPDDNYKIGSDFFVALIIISFPVLIAFKPWNWDVPLFSKISAIFLIPFLATFFIYTPILFLSSFLLFRKTHSGIFRTFFIIAFISSAFVLLSYFLDLDRGFSSIFTVVLTAWAVYSLNSRNS